MGASQASRGVGVAAISDLLLLFAADAPDSYTFAAPQRMLFAHTGSFARASSARSLGRQLCTHLQSQPGGGPDPGEAGGGQAASEGQAQGGGHRDQLLVAALKHVKTLVRLGSMPWWYHSCRLADAWRNRAGQTTPFAPQLPTWASQPLQWVRCLLL